MIPLGLDLYNFMGHSESHIDFTNALSVIVIIGIEDSCSDASNGVGKTTIFSGIKYALHGTTLGKVENIIRRGTNRCKVVFTFKMSDGKKWKIERTRTKTNQNVELFEWVNNDWINRTQRRSGDGQADITKLIKISSETFDNSSYFKQLDNYNLASAKPSQRKAILREMLWLGIWEKYEKYIKDEIIKPILKQIDNKDILIIQLGEPQKDINELKKELEDTNTQLTDIISALERKESELLAKRNYLVESQQSVSVEYPMLVKKLENAISIQESTEKAIKVFEKDLDKRTNTIVAAEKRELDLTKKIANKTKELEDYTKKIEKLHCNISKEDINNAGELVSNKTRALREIKAELKVLSNKLPDTDYCENCGGIVKDNAELLASREMRAKNLSEKQTGLETELETATKLYNDITEKISLFENTNSSIESIKKEISKAKIELAELQEEVISNKNQIKSTEEEILSYKTSLHDAVTNKNNIQRIIESLDAKSSQKMIVQLEQEIKTLEIELSKLRSAHSNLISKIAIFRERIGNRAKDRDKLDDLNKEKQNLIYQLSVAKAAGSVFGAQGVPTMIINTSLEAIQYEANKVLDILKPGIQLQFEYKEKDDGQYDEKLFMKFFENGVEVDYETGLSGGYKTCVALALKFAISTVNRKRCGSDIQMLLLDEVDQPLDKRNLNNFAELLKNWSKEMTILVITHNDQLKSHFNNFILVNKNNGAAQASMIVN